jgi:hypothetical protein
MEQNKAHIIYTAADVQRYLGGKMTPLEMNALEKAALDDPFLAEAIEGYAALPEADWSPALQSLKQGFAVGPGQAKVVQFTGKKYNWLKYAAAVLVIGGGIGTYFMLNRGGSAAGDDKTIAAAEKTAPDAAKQFTTENTLQDSPATAAIQPGPDANATKTLLDKLKKDTQLVAINTPSESNKGLLNPVGIIEYKKENENVTAEKPRVAVQASPATSAAPAARANDVAVLMEVNAGAEKGNDAKSGAFYKQAAINANASQASAKDRQEVNNRFFAQVVDANNNPLPFANISVKNENFGTYADVKGNVRLVSTDSVIPIEVKSVGFKPRTILLQNSGSLAQNLVVLQEDETSTYREKTAARKKVSTGVMSRRAMLQKDSAQNAEPADGWDNYGTYVSNNFEIPDEIVSKNIHGSVQLSFDIKQNGAVTNVKVDKSLCNDCDEIARRIVEQGPQWKPKKGRKTKAKVIVQF